MKVVSVVLNNFTNDSRVLKECLSLKKVRYDVKVVALHADNLLENEIVNGINVTRIRLFSKKWSSNLLTQLFKYIEFVIKFLIIVQREKADIIHCNDLEPLPASVFYKWISRNKVKIMYDAHELETERNSNINPYIYKLQMWTEAFFIKFIDKMITVSDGIAQEYVKRYSIKKPGLVMNAPAYQEPLFLKPNKFREHFGIKSNQKIFLYQGGLTEGRGIEILLEVFKQVETENIVLVIMGYGPLQHYIEKAARENKKIFFHHAVSPNVLLEYTLSADFGILLYENICLNHYYCLPNKLFEYIMVGLPVLLSDLYELRKMNEKYHIGTIAEQLTYEKVCAAIQKLIDDDYTLFRNNALHMAKEVCWEVQEKKLLSLYRDLLD